VQLQNSVGSSDNGEVTENTRRGPCFSWLAD
jgi:hypothetical protein